MTNFERNMNAFNQRKNKTNVINAITEKGYDYSVSNQSNYFFIQVQGILIGDIVIEPSGRMASLEWDGDDPQEQTFETIDDVMEWVEWNIPNSLKK